VAKIELLGEHRSPMNKDKDLITRGEARAIAEEMAVKIAEHYMRQVPQICTELINGALMEFGLVTKEQLQALGERALRESVIGSGINTASGDVPS
jgi:hypothetical protein